ncbi:MAG: MBL fold metallo-hydrolase, partial [Polyangiaceae bacterium]
AERVRALEDGATFALGDAMLSVHHTAGHANHHFVVDDPALETVYTGDTFGLVYPALQAHGRFAFPSTSPTNFDPAEARKSLDRVLGLGAKAACLTHFGEVRDLDEVASQMRTWIDRAERWLDEATHGDETFEAITSRLTEAWRDAVTEAASIHGAAFVEAAHRQLAMDIELNAQGIAVVAIARRKLANAAR